MPDARWQADRHELAITFGRTLDADQRLRALQAEQQQALRSCRPRSTPAAACVWSQVALSSHRPARSRKARPPCGSEPTWIASHRTSTSPTCSPRSKGGPGSQASSRTPRARPHASAIFSSICTRRCSPQAEPRADPNGGVLLAQLPPAGVGDRVVSRRRTTRGRERCPRRLSASAAARSTLGHRRVLKLGWSTLRCPRPRGGRRPDGPRVRLPPRRAEPRQLVVSAFLRHLAARGCSPNTLAAYAYDLRHLWLFLAARRGSRQRARDRR
jgi:hypothetical protein